MVSMARAIVRVSLHHALEPGGLLEDGALLVRVRVRGRVMG